MHEKRKKIWIDRFQTQLCIRLSVYFALYQLAVWFLFVIDARLNALTGVVGHASTVYGFALTPIVTIGLGLVFLYDTLKLTHRFVGPLYRIRKTVRDITAGEEIGAVSLRDGDYLQEFKDDLNEMLRALERRGAITINAPTRDKARETVGV